MNYQTFTIETLMTMHYGAREALITDDELAGLGQEAPF